MKGVQFIVPQHKHDGVGRAQQPGTGKPWPGSSKKLEAAQKHRGCQVRCIDVHYAFPRGDALRGHLLAMRLRSAAKRAVGQEVVVVWVVFAPGNRFYRGPGRILTSWSSLSGPKRLEARVGCRS